MLYEVITTSARVEVLQRPARFPIQCGSAIGCSFHDAMERAMQILQLIAIDPVATDVFVHAPAHIDGIDLDKSELLQSVAHARKWLGDSGYLQGESAGREPVNLQTHRHR